MAYSQVIINFNSIPNDGQVLNFSETNKGLSLNEIFKTSRLSSGQVTIPQATKGRYEMLYSQNANISDIGVRYMPYQGIYEDAFLSSIITMDNIDGTFTAIVDSFSPPSMIYMSSGTQIIWNEGQFQKTSESYSDFISDNYKNAFDLDYNNSSFFTLTSENAEEGYGLGSVIITANYPNAVFVLGTKTADVTVTINNDNTVPIVTFVPNSLNFAHKQNESLPSKNISMSGNLWKVVGKPNFLLTSGTAGVVINAVTDGSGSYQIASGSGNAIVTIALTSFYNKDSAFLPSDLEGTFAVLENDIPFGQIAFSVSVSRFSDFVTIPYLSADKAFTLDPKFFEISSDKVNTYFEFNAVIKTYDFFTNALNEYFIPQKIILFKGKSKINIGQIIHRLMRNFEKPNDNFIQYNLSKLIVNCTEKSIIDETIVRSGTSPEIAFIAGLSRGFSQFGFLDFNPKPNRVTVNSFAYLNMHVPYANYELRTFKNGNLVESLAIAATADHVLCKKMFFNTYAQGDIIEYVLDVVGENNEMAPKKTFIVFPEGNYSNMIVWEDEFLVQKAIECTGTVSIDGEVEFQSRKKHKDFVEKLEHLSSSKEVKLLINTGWLLFTDIDTVESLMRSKRAWLIQADNTISLRPIAKKLPKKDLDQELISFPLEFTINRNYDEETYSF
ncbi:hypothetical protein ACMDB5_13255 [Flavobacterium sp. W1B]|uniref:hypothetical protein n=1 Tax=Flavobacterium sp. W1B TaxID=3394146 RepID=UPI0039BC5669